MPPPRRRPPARPWSGPSRCRTTATRCSCCRRWYAAWSPRSHEEGAMRDDTRGQEPGQAASPELAVCARLRTKMYYVLGRDHVDLREESPTAQYWCSRTTTVIGPDDGLCVPHACQPHRACFEPAD